MRNYILKILSSTFLILLSFFILTAFNYDTSELIEYQGTIEHLTFNTLISFPDKALKDNNNADLIDNTKITPYEFKKILQELYSNNYILVNMKDLYFIENNTINLKPLFIPKNKKPIILSFNNTSYKNKSKNIGETDKIIIDKDDKFATYSIKQNIQNRISHDNEFLPILEDFIDNNPDFSHNNARGIIFLNIDQGILGYQINSKNINSKHDQKRIFKIIQKLSTKGWEFGSNNFSYVHDSSLNDMEFTKNITQWKKHATTIISPTPYYSSPYGEKYNSPSQLKILKDNDFRILFYDDNISSLTINNQILFCSRKFVSGLTLRNNPDNFVELFDAKKIYDHNSRTVPYNN